VEKSLRGGKDIRSCKTEKTKNVKGVPYAAPEKTKNVKGVPYAALDGPDDDVGCGGPCRGGLVGPAEAVEISGGIVVKRRSGAPDDIVLLLDVLGGGRANVVIRIGRC
jgi:hypothetical protein